MFDTDGSRAAVLSGVFRHGRVAFEACEELVGASDFEGVDQLLYAAAQEFYADGRDRKIDYPGLLAVAKRKGYDALLGEEARNHVRELLRHPADPETVREEAKRILTLRVARELDDILPAVRKKLRSLNGSEPIDHVVGLVENPILDYTASLNDCGSGTQHIADGIDEWFDNVEANPRDNTGIPTPYPRYNDQIGGGFLRGGVTVVAGRPKSGKALSVTAKVFTPNGPVNIGDITPGDVVSTPDGSTARVLSVHPQGQIDLYRVVFADGDSVECSDDHLWEVQHFRRKTYEIRSLKEILEEGLLYRKQRKWKVRLPESCYYQPREVPIDPYLFGYLIGNGCFRQESIGLVTPDAETVERLRGLVPPGHVIHHEGPKSAAYKYRISSGWKRGGCLTHLRSLGLWGKNSHQKFIPDLYKYNSSDVRMSLLQGLCDSDGSASLTCGNIEYTTVSGRLAEDIKEVVQSVGGLCHVAYRKTRCRTGEFWSYRLHIKHDNRPNFFRLSRKKNRTHVRKKPPIHRTIRGVEYVGKKPAQCIKVDSHDGLYMTDHHVVTHNTTWLNNVAMHVAGDLQIPVFNVDTEMTTEGHWARLLSHLSGVPSKVIRQGKHSRYEGKLIREKIRWLKSIPYFYRSVIEDTFEEQVAAMRRWAVKTVGSTPEGRRKDCLVLYDYLQMTDPKDFSANFKEYQILGFRMVQLSRFAKRYDLPILTMLQLSREGQAAGSDRILWKCDSLSSVHKKSPEEMEAVGEHEGNTKLIVEDARYGPGCEKGDYIHLKFEKATSKMTEGRTHFEVLKSTGVKPSTERSFPVEDDTDGAYALGEAESPPSVP